MEEEVLVGNNMMSDDKQISSSSSSYGVSDTLFKTPSIASRWTNKTPAQLSNMPIQSISSLLKELQHIVQEASGELVWLLQERQGLQEEVDIRSITIEQLLKFAEKRQLQLGEPLAIQMSVVRRECDVGKSIG